MKQMASITVIGKDKTGVVARVTGFLFECSANIEALEEQVTRGQFSMTILASWKDRDWDFEKLKDELTALGRGLEMEIRVRAATHKGRKRMALLATQETHCFEAVMREIRAGRLKTEPVLVIANHKEFRPLAEKYDLPFHYIPWDNRDKAEDRALEILDDAAVDLIVLARFMKILSPKLVWRYKNKIINIHPSLLPSFPGPQAYRQAYEHGVKIIGVTAHFVSMHLDEGPIITQESFRVKPGMSLKEIVAQGQQMESRALVKAVKLFLANRLDVYWGTVKQV